MLLANLYWWVFWLFIATCYCKRCHNKDLCTYISAHVCVSVEEILRRGIAWSMFYDFKIFDRSSKWPFADTLPIYNPITDEWREPHPTLFLFIIANLGWGEITHFCLDLHFPDYWWDSPSFHAMVVCISPFVDCSTVCFDHFSIAILSFSLHVLHIFWIDILHLPYILKFSSSLVPVF